MDFKYLRHGLWLLVFFANPAGAYEYHGYLRSGIGASRGGTDQACFTVPGREGAARKFRLGNECETYVEQGLVHDFVKGDKESAPYFRGNVLFSMESKAHRDFESTQTKDSGGNLTADFTLALREAYVQGLNVFSPKGASLWVGKRYYQRRDIHMLDYYYLENAGPGAGIEDIALGFGSLDLAVTRNTPDDDGPAQTNIDARLGGLGVAGGGQLEPVFIYGSSGERGAETGGKKWEKISGVQLGLIHTQPEFFGGVNTFVMQYGIGIFGGNGASNESTLSQYGAWNTQSIAKGNSEQKDARDDSSTLRLIDDWVINHGERLASEFVLLYQNVDFGGAETSDGVEVPNKQETTIGYRPIFILSDVHSLAFEYGYSQVKNGIVRINSVTTKTDFADSAVHKFTVAPQVSFGTDYFSRPQLRLFATYAKWNDDSKGLVGGKVYQNSTTGWNTGAQVEAWW